MHNFCYVNGIVGLVYISNFVCRLRHNEKLYELLFGPNTVKYMKIKRSQWAGHIECIEYREKCSMENFMEEDLWEDCD